MVAKVYDDIVDKEFDLILTASEELGQYGRTRKKCPRCGNDFEMIVIGTSYLIKCKTENCIQEGFRGI